MKNPRILLWALIVLLPLSLSAEAADWPQWRGPSLNGSTDETNLPGSWSEDENILWATPLPGPSGATPVISGDRIFVSSMFISSSEYGALCLDAKSGEKLWEKIFGSFTERYLEDNNPASPSPVTDGNTVVFYYSTGKMEAFDIEGNPLWSKNLIDEYGPFHIKYGYSSSPLLYEDKLYIPVLRRDRPTNLRRGMTVAEDELLDSYLLALDFATGQGIFKETRTTNAYEESMESYTTPMPFNNNSRMEIICNGGDFVTAHDPETGKEIWRFEYQTSKVPFGRIIPSLVPIDNFIIGTRYKHNGVFGLKPGGSDGSPEPEMVWDLRSPSPDASTPLYYKDRVYAFNGIQAVIACLEPETGEVIWQGQIDSRAPFRASMTGADDKLYCISELGEVVVLAAGGDEFKILFETTIDEPAIRSSIAVADGKLFIRTAENLYCIGK
ncbi:PQQ-binding-like beta-propeller repeat protein [Planctomycetota bacterium]